MPSTVTGGPHGMHPVGQGWVSQHHDVDRKRRRDRAQCQACHGTDYRGTVLSRAQADRQLIGGSDSALPTSFFRGAIVGCYNCHNGPNSESINTSPPPVVTNVATNTANDQSRSPSTLPATGANLTLRIISQPAHGSVGVNGQVATYFPDPGFVGIDTFTFAA